jgi:hypothetical protein
MDWLPWAILAVSLYASVAVALHSWYRQRGGSMPSALLSAADVDVEAVGAEAGQCARCGVENAAEYTYCRNCATRLSTPT